MSFSLGDIGSALVMGLGDALGIIPGGTIIGAGKVGSNSSEDDIFDLLDPGYYFHKSPAERNYEQKQQEAKKRTSSTYDQMEDILKQYNEDRTRLSTPEMAAKYGDLISSFNPEDYDYQFGDFKYGKTRDDFVNPYRDQILQDVAKNVQSIGAGSGLGLSRGTLQNAIKAQMEKDEELWKDSNEMLNRDRDFEYRKYSDTIANNQKRLENLMGAKERQISLLGGAIGSDQEAESDYMRDLLAIMGDKTKSLNDIELSNKEETRSPVDLAAKILPFFA